MKTIIINLQPKFSEHEYIRQEATANCTHKATIDARQMLFRIADADVLSPQMTNIIFRKAQPGQSSVYTKGNRVPAEWFSGLAWLNPLVSPNEINGLYSIGQVICKIWRIINSEE